MTFKSILVHVYDTIASDQRVRVATGVAKAFDATVAGIHFVMPAIDAELAQLPPREIAVRISEEEMRERVEGALQAQCEKAGVRVDELRVVERNAVDTAIAEMRCADLSVLAQGDLDRTNGRFERRLAEQSLLAVGGPIVFVPYAPAKTDVGERIVVAWDGGREAARALRDALPLLGRAKRVTVLSFAPPARLGQDISRSQMRLAAYLRAYAIEADMRQMACDAREGGELLLSQLADLNADLLVMGGYGHARVREIALGGVTRTILDSMTVPVLMSH